MNNFIKLVLCFLSFVCVAAHAGDYKRQTPGTWLYAAEGMAIYSYLADTCESIPMDDRQRMRQVVEDLTDIIEAKGFERTVVEKIYNDSLENLIHNFKVAEKEKSCNDYNRRLESGEAFVIKMKATLSKEPTN